MGFAIKRLRRNAALRLKTALDRKRCALVWVEEESYPAHAFAGVNVGVQDIDAAGNGFENAIDVHPSRALHDLKCLVQTFLKRLRIFNLLLVFRQTGRE